MRYQNVEDLIAKLAEEHPGYHDLISQVTQLVTTFPPPFVFVNDPTTPRIASKVLHSILEGCSETPQDAAPSIRFAHVNAIACFTARIFYDTVLNAMARWNVRWEDGCENYSGDGSGQRWNDSVDGLVHGLRAIHAEMSKAETRKVDSKGKGKETEGSTEEDADQSTEGSRMVLVVERAEKLKETLPDLLVPLTRLAELTRTPITVIFLSDVQWQDIKPSLGASPTPYLIDIPSPQKQATLQRLAQQFERESHFVSSTDNDNPYHPALLPLYKHFSTILYSICSPFTHDPHELAYISAARWPGFVQPVLDEHKRKMESWRDTLEADPETQMTLDDDEEMLKPPTEDVRMRLMRLFTPSMTAALETLYPRLTNASAWARANVPESSLLSLPFSQASPSKAKPSRTITQSKSEAGGGDVLPRMSKFIVVAAFLASTNPAKSDLRMFGRGLDERKKKRKGGGTRKGSGRSSIAKVPQRLLGPTPFPLDRLIAILGALLEDNDVDTRPHAPQFTIPGEYTDMEITRVHVYASIMELTQNRLLHRTTPSDRLDGPPMFKCGVAYDVVLDLAREIQVPLNDLMWDPA